MQLNRPHAHTDEPPQAHPPSTFDVVTLRYAQVESFRLGIPSLKAAWLADEFKAAR